MPHVEAMLRELTSLAHEFGGPRYVKGDSGSVSAKTAETLWVKPTGRPLVDLRPGQFVALSRRKLAKFDQIGFADDPRGGDQAVRAFAAEAVLPQSPGRPSVEAAIHDALPAPYWVRFFPSPTLAVACGREGREAVRDLFPRALWVPYAPPGLGLNLAVRNALDALRRDGAHPPKLVFLQHHGLYVGDETPAALRDRVNRTLDKLEQAIQGAGVSLSLEVGPEPGSEAVGQVHDYLLSVIPDGGGAVVIPSGAFRPAGGPIIPEHVIHAGGFAVEGLPTAAEAEAFRAAYGFPPQVFSRPEGVYAAGSVFKEALLAMEFAREMALVERYAAAFGGIDYLPVSDVSFVRQWNTGRAIPEGTAKSG